MIKAVFFDIDGTLIDTSTHTIPTSTIEAIQSLRNLGYKVAIASGRDIKNIKEIPFLDMNLFDGFVASNGMCIFDYESNCIHKHSYKKEDIKFLLTFAQKHRITLVFETMEDIYVVNELNEYVDIANEYYHEITPPTKPWQGEEVVKISCFQKLDFSFEEVLHNTEIKVLASPTTTYDLTLHHVSKLTGIHEMMRHWKLPEDKFMCFGDHLNDLEMMQGASIGIAVKDPLGSQKLQEIADATCESAGNDGIYRYLKDNGYI